MCEQIGNFDTFSVAMPEMLHDKAVRHLLEYYRQRVRQENLCFGLWRPSRGTTRVTALVHELVLPQDGELELDGAVFDQGSFGEAGGDLYEQAVQVVLRDQKASTSYIQRRLQIGYNRAASIMERMEVEGIVGPANHAGKREILVEDAVG